MPFADTLRMTFYQESHMRHRFYLHAVLTLMLIALSGSALQLFAQGTASISGTAADVTHAAVPSANVVLTNSDTNQERHATSSAEGYFEFTDLTPGHYALKVGREGFKTWIQTSITLEVAQHVTIYPQLEIGAVSEHVEVATEPPAITTSNSDISHVITSEQIEQLPLNGRNALQLVSLVPGVVPTGTAGQFGATQVTFSSSGGRDIDTNYSLDGGFNEDTFYSIANPYPNPDALQEFAVVTRNYSAMFGKGSTDVSAVTRSGTNTFHGSLFEFVRDTALNATPYFTTLKPNFQRNQFGGALGGPIVRNTLFFFLSYQGTKQSGGPGTQTYTTAPLAQRTGDFSGISTPVIDPQTGKQFPGNIIPANRITSQASAFFASLLPAPNQGPNTYAYPNVSTLAEHQGIVKVDYQITKRDFGFARYFVDDVPQVNYAGTALDPSWIADEPTRYQNTTIGEVHTFSSHLLNDFHFSYVRSAFGVLPRVNFSLAALGYGINQSATTKYGLTPDAALAITGSFSASTGSPTRDIAPTTHITDNLSWQHGAHTINVGGTLYRNRINETQNYLSGGYLTFNGQTTGVGVADFLLGRYSSYIQVGSLTARLHQSLPSFYAQDDFKISPRITISAGVRWDIATGYTSEDGQLLSLQPGKQSTVFPLATPGLLYPGDAGIPKNVVGTRWNNIAPRLGLAWDVFGNGRTSVRTGFGAYYVPLTRGITLNRLTLLQPYVLQVNISGGDAQNIFAAAPFNGVNPFPRATASDYAGLKKLSFVPTAGESSLPTTFKTEVNYEWSLSLQQALWKRSTIEVDYVGASDSHLTTSAESNPAVYTPGSSTTSNTQSRRLYPQIGSVNSILNVLSANYNALQVDYNQRMFAGLFIKSAFTWSKALGVSGAQSEGSNGPRDPFHYPIDYSPLSIDVTDNWVNSVIWKPLSTHHFSPGMNALVGGWQVGGIAILRSGTPINLTSGRDNSLTGIGADTPDIIGNFHMANKSKADMTAHWFNPAAFTQNAIGTFGTFGKNGLRGPGYINVDLNLQKNLRFAEKYGVELKCSMYNAFNHANLSNPTTGLTSANFGKITTATAPRVIEFGIRTAF